MKILSPRYMRRILQAACLLFLFSFGSAPVYGQTFKFPTFEESERRTGANLIIGDSLIVWCRKWDIIRANPTSWGNTMKLKSNTTFIKFGVDEFDRITKTSPVEYTYRLTYRVRGYNNPADTVNAYVENSDTLTIGFNNNQNNEPYQGLNLKKYSGFYKVKIYITGLYSDVAGVLTSPITTDRAFRNFYIEGAIATQFYDKAQYGVGAGTLPPTVSSVPSVASNSLDIAWSLSSLVTPVNYELEWTFTDDYSVIPSVSGSTVSSLGSPPYCFRNNSTRIWLDTNAFRLPLTYPRGYVVYRVRAVRPDSVLYKYPIYGEWSNYLLDSGSIASAPSNAKHHITSAYQNDSLNWQYTVSFAEGGKYKQVASFFDGLLKKRQSITRYNSAPSKLIVSSDIYDYEGRLSIKTLPAPVSTVGFNYQFDVAKHAITLKPYKASDFDSGLVCPNNQPIAPLAATAKASIYYSPLNPDTAVVPWAKYVPDAQGYPMIQTVYEPGYADRIHAQGGAGPRLQVADSNYITNSYVGVAQKVVNSLFGSNIGWSSYYTMTVNKDANQQLSMSIKDYEGRQMASALIGSGPDSANHAISPNSVPASASYSQDLLYPNDPNQAIDTLAGTRSADADFYNQATGYVTLQYQYKFVPYTVCTGEAISVKGHYRSYITDECGNNTFSYSDVLGTNGVGPATPLNYTGTPANYYSAAGPYHVHKDLAFYPADVAAAVDSFMGRSLCLKKKETFIKESVDTIQFPCVGADNADSNACSKMKMDMMRQLYPGGDYGKYVNNGGHITGTDNSVFSVIYPVHTYHVNRTFIDTIPTHCYHALGRGLSEQWSHYYFPVSPSVPVFFYDTTTFSGHIQTASDTCVSMGDTTFSIKMLVGAPLKKYRCDSIKFHINNVLPLGYFNYGITSGEFRLVTNTDSFGFEAGNITSLPAGGGTILGVLQNIFSPGFHTFSAKLPFTVFGNAMTTHINGYLPSGASISIDYVGNIDTPGVTNSTIVGPVVHVIDSIGVDSSTYIYRYQDTCAKLFLPSSITVAGITYNNLRTMSADSFIMVYNGAIAEGNTTIAEALLPLHPQYCELQNCFVDSFKEQLTNIPGWQVAQSLGVLALDDIVAHDPIVPLMQGSGLFPHPMDSLKTYPGGVRRLDTFLLMTAYCGCNDTFMFSNCASSMFSYEIAHHLLVNSEVKSLYFKTIYSQYFANRQAFINKLFMKDGNSCAHCAVARMTLDPAADVMPIASPPPTGAAADSAYAAAGGEWLAGIASMDSAALYDSTAAFYHATDSLLAYATIDTIVSHLSNCIAGNGATALRIKDTLINAYRAGNAASGNFTYGQILHAITSAGIALSDLCNPYVIDCSQFGAMPPTPQYDCMASGYYANIQGFFGRDSVLAALKHQGSTRLVTLDTTTNIFERNMARAIHGYNNSSLKVTYFPAQHMYEMDVFATAAGIGAGAVKLYLRAPACGNIFATAGSSFSVAIACVNSSPDINSATGLVNEYSFAATVTVTGSAAGTCKMLGWVDSMQTMGFQDNTLAKCVPCTQMKTLYKQFVDTMHAYSVLGTDHPYYGTMLANFMNVHLQQSFTSGDYETFITSCAIADSMNMPLYNGYASFTFATVTDMNNFMSTLNGIDPLYTFRNIYRDSMMAAPGDMTVCVSLNAVPRAELWKYKDAFNNPSLVAHTRVVNLPFSSLQITGEIGYLYSSPSYPFTPRDSSIIDTASIRFIGPYAKKVWIGGRFELQDFYDVVALPGAPAYAVSRAVYQLSEYIYRRGLQGVVFTPSYQHTVDGDYFKPQKQAYLKYTYAHQQLPLYEVLDSVREAYLPGRIPSYAGYLPGYAQAGDAGTFTSLYLSNSGMTNRLYDTLQRVLNIANGPSVGAGRIFHTAASLPVYSSGPMALTAYVCADGSYWYRYFTTGDSLFNVYVAMPSYIPQYLRSSYYVTAIIPTPGDSLNRSFTLNLRRIGDTTTIQAKGRTSFVIGKSIELSNVLLGQYTPSDVTGMDTFDNCERQRLGAAINKGIVAYNNYIDSTRNGVRGAVFAYLGRSVNEQLLLSYQNSEFNYTLYNYDRAGNLAFTVPPAGVNQLPNIGATLDNIDTARMNNTPATPVVYSKINRYNYNSYNLVTQQNTIDAGKTRFFYDNAGRLVFSQNARQAALGSYTYNIYDDQNRTTETGEVIIGCPFFDDYTSFTSTVFTCGYSYLTTCVTAGTSSFCWVIAPDPPQVRNVANMPYDAVVAFLRTKDRSDVVMTVYDTAATNLAAIKGLDMQENLRKRVSCVKFFDHLTIPDVFYTHYSYATHYSYDVDGSVKTLTQDFPDLATVKQRYKRIDYDYDLISGKVNMLSYDKGWPDQFYQQYSYDADNRIVAVNTSNDGYIWQRDAAYYYYQHGPLARVELGDMRVQGIDYAYTIQGWLKSMNNDTLNPTLDMGLDGTANNVTAKDAVAYGLDYFRGDYKPVGSRQLQHTPSVTKNLYNGNISRQTQAYKDFMRLNKQYAYDQLNRIKSASYASVDAVSNTLNGLSDFRNNYSYDPDGNLKTLNRYGNQTGLLAARLMDSLVYKYTPAGTDNKLQQVYDYAPDNYAAAQDLKPFTSPTAAARYNYDAIGNTTKDLASGQDTIKWNLYNKVVATQNNAGRNTMAFRYDGMGNRTAKYYSQSTDSGTVEKDDYYVRDAQGNILAIYHQEDVYGRLGDDPRVSPYRPEMGPMRLALGGATAANNLFVTPEFSADGYFSQKVIDLSQASEDFVNTTLDKPVSYFLYRNGQVSNMLYSGTAYIPALVGADASGKAAPIIGPALCNSYKVNGDGDFNVLFSAALGGDAMRHTLGMLCQVPGGDLVLRDLHNHFSSQSNSVTRQLATYTGAGGGGRDVDAAPHVSATRLSEEGFGVDRPCDTGGLSGRTMSSIWTDFDHSAPHFYFKIIPDAGYSVSLTGFAASLSTSATGPAKASLAYSVDGGVNWVSDQKPHSITPTACGVSIDIEWSLGSLPAKITDSVLVAVFPYASIDTFGKGNFQVNGITITGTVSAPMPGDSLACDSLVQYVVADSADNKDLGKAMMRYADDHEAIAPLLALAAADTVLYADAAAGDLMRATVQQAIATSDTALAHMVPFFDDYDGARAMLYGIGKKADLLRVVYNDDPGAYINSFNDAFGDSAVDAAVAAIPGLSALSFASRAFARTGVDLHVILAGATGLKYRYFSLAEHDIYGSSRLGIRSYYPKQVGLGYDDARKYYDTVRLWNPVPWYSLEYQDVIKKDSMNLYGNAMAEPFITQLVTGTKQYEITDHLGNVLTTVSDKRAAGSYTAGSLASGTSTDTIATRKPVVVNAYDYYPFGQYMPGRYTEDSSSYCFTTTLTEMVTVVTYVPAPVQTLNRLNNASNTSPQVSPLNDGGILIRTTEAGTGVSWPIDEGTSVPGTPGEINITASVDIGVFTVSVVDETTTTVVGSVNVFSTQGESVTIKVPYTHTGTSTGTTIHIKHVDGIQDTNIIRVHTVMVPVYTSVPQNVVSTVCNSENYRYGYNGQMKVNEWAGLGNHWDFKYRGYDPRIGRFSSVDPLTEKFPWYTPYQFAGNTPIQAIDLDGAEEYHYTMTMNNQGKAALNLVSQRDFNHHSWFGGLIEFDTKIDVKRYIVDYEGDRYHIGFAQEGTGYANAWKADAFKSNYIDQKGDAVAFPYNYVDDNHSQAGSDANTIINAQNYGAETAIPFESPSKSAATVPYKRPNNATTPAQRASVQGKPCVTCGQLATPMVADHIYPLVQEHYETGGIDQQRMKSVEAVQPQCPTCSSKQGAELRKYGQEQKAKLPPPNGK